MGVLLQDIAYMVTVPFFCPETPYLRNNPVFLYSADRFERPNPFRADVVVAIDDVIEKKVQAMVVMESQFVEGGALGYNDPLPDNDPAAREARRQRARERFHNSASQAADHWRAKLIELYGEELGKQVRYAEAFEICEYGRHPSPEELRAAVPVFSQ